MAREVILRDDLDGSYDDVQTCILTWQDTTVEVDLSASNRDRITAALTPAIDAGRRQRRPSASRPTPRPGRPSRAQLAHRATVRAWAHDNGLDAGTRGPIPEQIEHAYAQAHGEAHTET